MTADPTKLKLYVSLRSPFARRIRMALDRVGTHAQGTASLRVEEQVIDVFNPSSEFLKATPLGLVPALQLTDGMVISETSMILEWIHQQTGLVYPTGPAEWPARQVSVWVHGLIQATVAFFQETKLHDSPSRFWSEDHHQVVADTLLLLNSLPADCWFEQNVPSPTLTQAGWDLAVALQYLELRMPHLKWNERFPQLKAPLALALRNQRFLETQPPV